jgi:hypothetical protein
MTKPRAILVSVDYSDILSLTLPYNRHHFDEVMVVTCPEDAAIEIAVKNGCHVFVTDLFWSKGASFNKWGALEHALDIYGRHGLLCVMDADVFWPRVAPVEVPKGKLFGPLRRMMPTPPPGCAFSLPPPEEHWGKWPVHRNINEWAGFSQIFWADDFHLGKRPWHEEWLHAGGGDSFFQAKWPRAEKIRPGWEVLHIGGAGENWFGRSTPYLDGTRHPKAFERQCQNRAIWNQRAARRASHQDPYLPEKA